MGDWIEIDPTWGTNFVDATHIRERNGALLTYALLDLVQMEVLETPHAVADYQKDPTTLAKELCKDLSEGNGDALQAASDVSAVTDELMGAGSWAAMTDKEHNQMSAAFTRVVAAVHNWLGGSPRADLRLLKVKVSGDKAEAVTMFSTAAIEDLVKLNLVKHGDAWVLTEVTEVDSGLKMISENLQPTLIDIRDRRSGKQHGSITQTDFARVIVMMQKNNGAALRLVDNLLKQNPRSQSLRYLRSLCLDTAEKTDEAAGLWTDLISEDPVVTPALRKLADYYATAKDESERTKAVELYKRYLVVEPDDPRPHTRLAEIYELAGNATAAEAEYRAASERDQTNSEAYVDLAQFYAEQKRFTEAISIVNEGEKHVTEKSDLFGELLGRFWNGDKPEIPETLAANQPRRMEKSFDANLYLARIRIDNNHDREALPLLRKAAALNNKFSDPYDLMAEAYRKLREWPAALNAADTAIRLDAEDADAYYHRACALTRLGRRVEAMTALKRALELDEDLADGLAAEEDLKSLSNLPEFKKLLPKPEQK